MEQYNKGMSAVRSSVEWLFGDVVNSFKFLDFKKNLKLMLSSIGKMYVVSVLLRNALTCLYGNETSDYVDLSPPSLQEYFSQLTLHIQAEFKIENFRVNNDVFAYIY